MPPSRVRRRRSQRQSQEELRAFFHESTLPKNDNGLLRRVLSCRSQCAAGSAFAPTGEVTKKRYRSHGLYYHAGVSAKSAAFPLPLHVGEYLLCTGRDFRLPWVLHAVRPSSAAPRDPDCRLIRRSKPVFVGAFLDSSDVYSREGPKRSRARLALPRPRCVCVKTCGDRCLNRLVNVECDVDTCGLKDPSACSNRAFTDSRHAFSSSRESARMTYVAWSNAGRGRGLFALRDAEPGRLLAEYCGEVIDRAECCRRMVNQVNYYVLQLDAGRYVDASRIGSDARFINHSCAPNCVVQKWLVTGEVRIGVFAGPHGVRAGEELSYDYNFTQVGCDSAGADCDRWFDGAQQQVCLCGARSCRGVIGRRRDHVSLMCRGQRLMSRE